MTMETSKRSQSLVAGVDLGGTGLRVLVIASDGQVRGSAHRATDRAGGPAAVLAQLQEAIDAATLEAGVRAGTLCAVGIGVAAAVDAARGLVCNAPNLRWKNYALGPRLSDRLGVPVVIENDVNVALLGEHTSGIARGIRDAIGIWVGTGVGGAVLLDGKIHQGHRGSAGEIGHMVVEPEGPLCGCGRHGCLETVASRTALQRALTQALAHGARSSIPRLMGEAHEESISMRILVRAVRTGDPLALRELSRVQEYLALVSANLVNLLDPLMVVFGGGLPTILGARFVAPIRTLARRHFLNRRGVARVRFVLSTLADSAGARGAATLARQHAARN